MSTQKNSQTMIIQLEVVPEDAQQLDITDIDEVGRSLFIELKSSGYAITPTPTGRKGGEPIFDILIPVAQFLHDNKDWLLASIPPMLESLLIFRDKLSEKEKVKRSPLKLTLEVDGKPTMMIIKTNDIKDATNLVERILAIHRDEAQNKVKIKVSVPRKKRRGSH